VQQVQLIDPSLAAGAQYKFYPQQVQPQQLPGHAQKAQAPNMINRNVNMRSQHSG